MFLFFNFLIHRFKSSNKLSGINILISILNWIWPPGRCQNCQSIYSSSLNNLNIPNLQQIHRSTDGRFVLNECVVDGGGNGMLVDSKRNSIGSQYSSSDDGGFIPRMSGRSSWRNPLVQQCPSEMSFHSDGFGQNRWLGLGRHLLRTVPQIHRQPTSLPITEHLHINTISGNMPGPMISNNMFTPSRSSRVVASSPATSNSPLAVNSPWSPLYFSDLSSVHPSSAERSFPTPQQGSILSPSHRSFRSARTSRYINELPALRSLHDDPQRMTHGFIPVHIPSSPIRSYYQNVGPQFYHQQPLMNQQTLNSYRPRVKTFPRYNRMLRQALPELSSPVLNLNLNRNFSLEQSPESYSSSSGFGSKNTSSHQNQSSQSGGTGDWRLPPYRPPPQPQLSAQHQQPYQHDTLLNSPLSPYSMSHWLELMQRLNVAATTTDGANFKAVDVGSVDGHYEFDPSTPTPTASTPTGRDDMQQQSNDLFGALRSKRTPSRYDNIDARVQAMKEEFYTYRKKQAIKRAGIVLESAC